MLFGKGVVGGAAAAGTATTTRVANNANNRIPDPHEHRYIGSRAAHSHKVKGKTWSGGLLAEAKSNVRFGSKAVIRSRRPNVRFAPRVAISESYLAQFVSRT